MELDYITPLLARLDDTYDDGDVLEIDAQVCPHKSANGGALQLETIGSRCVEMDRPRVEALRDMLTRWLETGKLEPEGVPLPRVDLASARITPDGEIVFAEKEPPCS